MNLTKNQFIIAGVTGFVVILAILIVAGVLPGLRTAGPENIAAHLSIWNVGDAEGAFATAFSEFKTRYRNVTFTYRAFPNETAYEAALLDALAAGTGPDIFVVRNDKLFRHFNKMAPVVNVIGVPELRERFPQVVEKDFYQAGGGTYALPLSIDTLALFYNRDLLDAAGIANPPTTWTEVQTFAPTLTKKDAAGVITQSGVALGGSAAHIPTAIDTLYLLMLQTGTFMTDDAFTRAAFDTTEGLNALRFYLQFGTPASAAYAWSPSAGNASARDLFADEKVAMSIDYSSAISALTARNSFLNYAVAPMPQPANANIALTYPSYYGFTVSRRSPYVALAWEFVKSMTTSETAARHYATTTGRPPALRALVSAYENDPVKRVFARQILTARSWPQVNPDAIRAAFEKLITSALADPSRAAEALRTAASEVTNIMTRN